MRALVQRVSNAAVRVNGQVTGEIGLGLLVFLGVGTADTKADAVYLASKIEKLRIFADNGERTGRSVKQVGGAILIVSQFTLYGDTRKGTRPSYSKAAPADLAVELYDYFVGLVREMGISVATGIFKADMKVTSTNDGPVTLLCKSESDMW